MPKSVSGHELLPRSPLLTLTLMTVAGMGAISDWPAVEDARRQVNYWADEGATSFKAYMHITRGELEAAITAAHARHPQSFVGLAMLPMQSIDLAVDEVRYARDAFEGLALMEPLVAIAHCTPRLVSAARKSSRRARLRPER